MRGFQRACLALVMFAITSACAAPTLYQWGHYEDSIFAMYLEPGSIPVDDEIARFEAEIEETVAAGAFVPPGVHAHLGYLYASQGDHATALIHFQTEKAKFPESTRFIDGLTERMLQ